MKRAWTPETIKEWTERRDAYFKAKGIEPMAELCAATDPQPRKKYRTTLDLERMVLLKRLRLYYTETLGWPIDKPPLVPYPAPFSGKLFLPKNFRQTHGTVMVNFTQNDDLNRIVHEFYDECADHTYPGSNFVTQHGKPIKPRRFEYMGPMPLVVDFRFDEKAREASIEWWDKYLQLGWIDKRTWRLEVYYDEQVQGWVSKIRGDYSRNLDLFEYVGCQE
ncbi:hypothetical protein OBBRIDRAFT_814331 [Obba rivulosa]|uniref:Uncharacterized protein n=1 Tax=Obba rivulosa TaxID=1052685 RepID=A0A8E2ARD3_9APHY|nr:hypothetical protein OBBRIDRAFT_814331 [Obba rivulosa]